MDQLGLLKGRIDFKGDEHSITGIEISPANGDENQTPVFRTVSELNKWGWQWLRGSWIPVTVSGNLRLLVCLMCNDFYTASGPSPATDTNRIPRSQQRILRQNR